MVRWSFSAESLSLITIVILFLFDRDKNRPPALRYRFYRLCLAGSACTIFLNALCIYPIFPSDTKCHWLNLLLNSLYFFAVILMCSLMAAYLFFLLLEHVYDKHCLHYALSGIIALTVGYTGLLLWNLNSGVLFFFDSSGSYHRGPLNTIGYGVMLVELFMLILCYLRNRSSISRPMRKVVHTLPPILFLVTLFQLFYPDLQLNGTLLALTNLVLFISFQTLRVDLDGLTGIGNRNSFYTELSLRVAGQQPVQIILVALRQFAQINHKYGHPTGDALLYQIAHYLDGFESSTHAFRFGNVEFALICPYQDPEQAQRRLTTLAKRLQTPWHLDKINCPIRASLVDVSYTGDHRTPAQLIEFLEYAVGLARKEEQTIVRFDPVIQARFQRRQYLVEFMHIAIQQRSFRVWYQPIFSCTEHTFCAAEALLRLTDRDGVPISPAEFIPIAEETGMIDPLSWIVLDHVCCLLGSGQVPHLQYISMNLSMQQFLAPSLAGRIQTCLNRYGVPPNRLKIEITERVLLEDISRARQIMFELQALGIGFCMDDFGTGYSNFSCLLELPFEYIKLDRSLIQRLAEDPSADLIVRTIIDLFHCMEKKVVAEGVETAPQTERLCAYGADSIQGFYYARPMPETSLVSLLHPPTPTSSSLQAPANG